MSREASDVPRRPDDHSRIHKPGGGRLDTGPEVWSSVSKDIPFRKLPEDPSAKAAAGRVSAFGSEAEMPDAGNSDLSDYPRKSESDLQGLRTPRESGQASLLGELFEHGVRPDSQVLKPYAAKISAIEAGVPELEEVLESQERASIISAIHEFAPQSIDLIEDVQAYVTTLRIGKSSTIVDLYAGKLALEALVDSLPDIGIILDISDAPEELGEWGLTASVIRNAANSESAVALEATATHLDRLHTQLKEVTESEQGARTLLGLLPAVTRIGSAATIGLLLGAAYSETVKGVVCALVATAAAEATDSATCLQRRAGKFGRARAAYVRLRASVLRIERVETGVEVLVEPVQHAIVNNALNLSIYSARRTSLPIRWESKRPYWMSVELISLRIGGWMDRLRELDELAPPRRKPKKKRVRSG